MMAEVDIAEVEFVTRVSGEVLPIDRIAYKNSMVNCWKLLWAEEEQLHRVYDPEKLEKKLNRILKLRLIIDDLQKAMKL